MACEHWTDITANKEVLNDNRVANWYVLLVFQPNFIFQMNLKKLYIVIQLPVYLVVELVHLLPDQVLVTRIRCRNEIVSCEHFDIFKWIWASPQIFYLLSIDIDSVVKLLLVILI